MRSLREKVSKAHRRLLALAREDEWGQEWARVMSQLEEGGQSARGLALELELVAIQRELAKAERQLREYFESAPEVFQATPYGKLFLANQALARMLGYDSPQELVASAPDMKLLQDSPRELRLRRKDGQFMWALASARAVRNGQGQIIYYEGAVKDISEQKRIQQALNWFCRQIRAGTRWPNARRDALEPRAKFARRNFRAGRPVRL